MHRQQAAQTLYDALAAWTAVTLQRLTLDEARRQDWPVSAAQRRQQWATLGDAELQTLAGGERFALALDALGLPRHALPLAA